MLRVKVEFWLWMGKELDRDFQSPSDMRSVAEIAVQEGITIRELLSHLAERYPPVGEKVFNKETGTLYPSLVLTVNDRVVSLRDVYEKVVQDGDKITVLPMYMGG